MTRTQPPSWQRIPGSKALNTGSLQGEVKDTQGQAIPGASISILAGKEVVSRSASDTEGIFRFPALPPGSYTLTITAPGFGSFTDNAVLLSQAGAANQFTLAAADAARFDLVISDLGLPDMTGNELMTMLRDRHGLPGIAVSGYGMEEDVNRSRDAGFVHHLTKPIQLDRLTELIAMTLESSVAAR